MCKIHYQVMGLQIRIIIVQVIFYFFWDHWAHPGYFENQIPLKLVGGGGGGGGGGWGGLMQPRNYSVA